MAPRSEDASAHDERGYSTRRLLLADSRQARKESLAGIGVIALEQLGHGAALDPGGVLDPRPVVGGALRNSYRRQTGARGLVAVGDSVATTTPTRGRGIAMACMQVTALLALLDAGADPVTIVEPFGAWCDDAIEPWVADHIAIDGGMVRRWQGEDLDLSIPLSSDLIAAAVEADPRIGQHAGGYFEMTALPATLAAAEPLARAVYESGWRPAYAPGPTRDELVDVIRATVP